MAKFLFHGSDGRDYYDIGLKDGCGSVVPVTKSSDESATEE